jgi:N-methylhydantoinase A
LSAAGAVVSDVGRGFRRLFVTNSNAFDTAGVRAKLDELRSEAETFAAQVGAPADATDIDYFVEARYAHQVWEIDVAIKTGELEGPNAAQALRAAFHDAHERIFAFRDENSMVEAIAWRAQVRCKVADTTELRIASDAAGETADRHRQAYFSGIGQAEVPVYAFERLSADVVKTGPAIVESRFTSIVVPPAVTFRRSASGNLIVQPGAATANNSLKS